MWGLTSPTHPRRFRVLSVVFLCPVCITSFNYTRNPTPFTLWPSNTSQTLTTSASQPFFNIYMCHAYYITDTCTPRNPYTANTPAETQTTPTAQTHAHPETRTTQGTCRLYKNCYKSLHLIRLVRLLVIIDFDTL